jgi:AcrR family transcriptional regulator
MPELTPKAEETRQRILKSALSLFEEQSFEATTLRQIAARAGVSLGLVYRYFSAKESFVLALYERLSHDFEDAARDHMPNERWPERFVFCVRTSLAVLDPYRETLRMVTGFLLKDPKGLYPPENPYSQLHVQSVFREAVLYARFAPDEAQATQLGRHLYVIHLAIVFFWLVDRSPGQEATERLLDQMERWMPMLAIAASTPVFRDLVDSIADAVLGPAPEL